MWVGELYGAIPLQCTPCHATNQRPCPIIGAHTPRTHTPHNLTSNDPTTHKHVEQPLDCPKEQEACPKESDTERKKVDHISLGDIQNLPTFWVLALFGTFYNFCFRVQTCRHLGGGGGMCILFEICKKTPFQKCIGLGGRG